MKHKLLFIVISFCFIQKSFSDISADNPINEQPSSSPDFVDNKDVDTDVQTIEPLAVSANVADAGNTELLSPSLRGLAAMATANLPENLRLIKVIEATREVVAGFRYDLTVEVSQPGDEHHTYPCRLTILERPWVITQWGARDRSLLSTNCSNGIDANSENNELLALAPRTPEQESERPTETPKVEPNYDSIADSGQVEELLEQYTDKDRVTVPDLGNNPDQVQEQVVEQQTVKSTVQNVQHKNFLTKVEALVGLKKWLDDVRIMQRTTQEPITYDPTVNPIFTQPDPVDYHKIAEEQPDALHEQIKQAIQEQEKENLDKVKEEKEVEQPTPVPQKQIPLNVISLNEGEVTENAEEIRTRRGLGSSTSVDSEDPYIQELMQGAFSQLSSSAGASDKMKLRKVTDCSKQVVSGTLVKCNLHISGVDDEHEHECEVKIWVRQWLKDSKETDITCAKYNKQGEKIGKKKYQFRAKKQSKRSVDSEPLDKLPLRGGVKPADANDPYIQNLMQGALAQLALSEGSSDRIKLHEVTDCTKQTVSGSIVNCVIVLEGLTDNKHNCEVRIWDRPWLDDAKETDIKCSEVDQNGVLGSEKKYEFKPQVRVERDSVRAFGAPSPTDENNIYVQELMQTALAQIAMSEGAGDRLQLHKLKDCTTQVVEGTATKCTMVVEGLSGNNKHHCEVSVWDRPWLKDAKETTVKCSEVDENGIKGSEKKYEFKPKIRVERDTPILVGGPAHADSNDPYIQNLMQSAFNQLTTAEGANDKAKLHKLEDCTTQVVAGSLIKCTMHIEKLSSDERHSCEVKIWDRPWLPDSRETDITCSQLVDNNIKSNNQKTYKFRANQRVQRSTNDNKENSRIRKVRGIPGGVSQADPEEAYIQDLMKDAFAQLVTVNAGGSSAVLHKVTDCTKQTVAGSLVKCKIHVHGLGANEKHECEVKVWDRPWLPDARETDITCSEIDNNNIKSKESKTYKFKANKRVQRSVEDMNDEIIKHVKGGIKTVDPNDGYIQELMKDAFAQLITANAGGSNAILHEVRDCTKQTVEGSLVKCQMHVHGLGENEKHECAVKVWDRPWLPDSRETDITCSQLIDNNIKSDKQKTYKFVANRRVQRSTNDIKENSRIRKVRGIPGGVSQADPEEAYIQDLMKDAFAQLVTVNAGQNSAVLHKVTDCTKQTVAGSLIKCKIHVHGLGANEKHECEVKVWDRPWLPDARETDITCSEIDNNNVKSKESKTYKFKANKRVQRSVDGMNDEIIKHAKGGIKAADPNDSYIQELMKDAFAQLVTANAGGSNAILHEVRDCTKQTVEGSLVKCQMHVHGLGENEKHECAVKVWDRPWLPDSRETDITCSQLIDNNIKSDKQKTYKFVANRRVQRSTNDIKENSRIRKVRGIPGGVSQADPEEKYIQDLMKDAFAQLVTVNSEGSGAVLHKVTDCTKQTVAGSLVKCKIHVHGLGANEKHECEIKVWDRPWLPDARETDITCSEIDDNNVKSEKSKTYKFKANKRVQRSVEGNKRILRDIYRMKRSARGAPKEVDSDDAYVQELMKDAFAQLVTANAGSSDASLHKVTSCTKQTVAGSLVKCKIIAHGLGTSEKHECDVKVWDRPWLPDARETDITCTQITGDNVKSSESKTYKFLANQRAQRSIRRMKRSAHGASKKVDSDNSYIQELMMGAFNQLVSTNAETNDAVLHKVSDCTKQTVAGTIVKCKLQIHVSGTKHECEIKVWDRPWIPDARETDATCTELSETNTSKGEPKLYEFRNSERKERSSNIFEHSMTHEDMKTWRLFAKFTQKHEKRYDADEARYRFNIFKENLKRIERLNRGELGTAHYGITQFSDLTPEEFKSRHTGLLPRTQRSDNELPHASAQIPSDIFLPESFDWRDHGAVTKVKDQGSCGSCWAFSVTGNIEGLEAIRSGKLQEFSEQELVDCDSIDDGCGGGLPDNAYKAIEQLGGLESESDYPYEGKKEKCHFDPSATRVQVSGAVDLPQNETEIALWLVKNGPISIGINANAMQFYRGGVSHPWKILCKPSSLDHGVLIVGYGVHTYPKFNKTMPYWIIKNSWGPRWGEQGYYRVYRGDGTCGVDQMATSAVLDKPVVN